MKVFVQDNQVERAIKALKREMTKEGVLKELKLRRYYEKPSVRKKRKIQESRKRRRKAVIALKRKRPVFTR